jgi:ATP adenylyltransferase
MIEKRPLWAPWRIDFIRSEKGEGCFLCGKRDDRSSPDEELVVGRGRHVFAILNRYPYNSGHLMIVPYRHIGDIEELEAEELYEMADWLVAAKKALASVLRPQGFNIGFNLGTAAGAGVKDHIHQHLVPRWEGDTNFMPVLGDLRVVPESLTATAALLRPVLAGQLAGAIC